MTETSSSAGYSLPPLPAWGRETARVSGRWLACRERRPEARFRLYCFPHSGGSAGEFVRAENELQELLDSVAQDSHSKVERRGDEFGFEWLIIRDNDFEELVATVHIVASELIARGFGEQLLAAAFRFDGGKHPVYWIYGFKRGAFWPFVPMGDGKERDNAEELELKAKMEKELPVEQDLTRWLALFDAPI